MRLVCLALHWATQQLLAQEVLLVIHGHKDCLCVGRKGLDAMGCVYLPSLGTAMNGFMSWEEAEVG